MRTSIVALLMAASVAAQQQSTQRPNQPQQPARDTSAQPAAPATGSLSGRVLTTEGGRPVKRARVFVSAPELPGGRAALTDENGVFQISELPAGRYSVNVSKTGYIALSYGQRRPLMAGTPLQLADGQQLKGIDFALPRGGVIAGRIVDEDGEPMIGAVVRVLRYEYMQGDRRLVPVGTGQTDDKGQYRVWGLMPGDYYVNAVGRITLGNLGRGGPGGPGGPGVFGAGPPGGGPFGGAAGAAGSGRAGGGRGAIADAIAGALGGNLAALFGGGGEDEPVAYAPTYFPGVGSVNEATPVRIGLSQEVADVNFGLQLVRTARVTGRVLTADGSPAENGNVQLTPEGAAAGGRGQIGMTYGSRIGRDGAFAMTNVPPGRYVLRARAGNRRETPEFAQQPLAVNGDVPDLMLALAPGGAVTGSLVFEAAQSSVDPSQIRVTSPAVDPSAFAPNTGARVEKDGTFTLDGIPAGARLIRANGGRGWTLKSVTINGHETIDTPIEIRPGQTIQDVKLVFTDKTTQISGTVTNESGQPVTDYTVLVFSTDEAFWRAQSRHIMTARPDQNGKYQMRGLPAGDYYVAVVDPAVQGEWFEPAFLDQHRPGAVRVAISEGDAKTQDLRVSVK